MDCAFGAAVAVTTLDFDDGGTFETALDVFPFATAGVELDRAMVFERDTLPFTFAAFVLGSADLGVPPRDLSASPQLSNLPDTPEHTGQQFTYLKQ